MKKIHEIYIIELKRACWENSTCTCRDWHKTLKYKQIQDNSQIQDKKRRRGKPKTIAPALQRQPSKYQEDNNLEICQNSDVSDNDQVPTPKKRDRKIFQANYPSSL